MARTRYHSNAARSSGSGQDPMVGLVVMGVFLAIGLFVLLPLFPPFGLAWCGIIGKAMYDELKKSGLIKFDGNGNVDFDLDKVKKTSQDAANKFKTRISASDMMEEKQPRRHVHTPVNYSYDSCARDKRLDQLKTLKEAGIIDEVEYKIRRQKVLAGK